VNNKVLFSGCDFCEFNKYLHVLLTELLADLLKQKPKESDGIDSVVVVDNIPKVGPEKQEKLKNMIRKIFGKFGKIQTEYFPLEGDTTKG
jgi:translation initiation factor 3 subunit B